MQKSEVKATFYFVREAVKNQLILTINAILSIKLHTFYLSLKPFYLLALVTHQCNT